MQTSRRIQITIISSAIGILTVISTGDRAALGQATALQEATVESTVESTTNTTPACVDKLHSMTSEATGEPTTELTAEVTSEPTIAPTIEATIESTQESGSLLSYLNLEPFDVRFNPNPEKAFAVVMNFTLFVENNAPGDLEVRKPQFELSIEGVPWTAVASTDFQMGTLQNGAKHGIVLQTLLLIKKATEAQNQVLDCIKAKLPVDLHLTGTLETTFNGKTELAVADVYAKQVLLPNGK